MKTVAIIPARYGSTRFPAKPLALIKGKPMIVWVVKQSKKSKLIDDIFVATDHEEIAQAVKSAGGKVILTDSDCTNGTERVYQALTKLDKKYDLVLNIQGDEPMTHPETLDILIQGMKDNPNSVMGTTKFRLTDKKQFTDPNTVKVVTDINDNALYFSRSLIPFDREETNDQPIFKHQGFYIYKPDFLKTFISMASSSLENTELLEQLRVLENGYKIKVWETKHDTISVDSPVDIKQVEINM